MSDSKSVDELREHYLRPGKGTQTDCSCGKSFGLSGDAQQHVQWQLAQNSQRIALQSRIDELQRIELGKSIRLLHGDEWLSVHDRVSALTKQLQELDNSIGEDNE